MKKRYSTFWSALILLIAVVFITIARHGSSPDPVQEPAPVVTQANSSDTDPQTGTPDTEQTDPSQSENPDAEVKNDTPGSSDTTDPQGGSGGEQASLPEDGTYTSKDEVALYLHLYGHLPDNFLTKKQAKNLGWNSSHNYVGEVAPGMSIGGDIFGNREGQLPEGHTYHECDIDYEGKKRNGKRIVYSEDGLIYYTDDHYETFTLLYGEE